MTVSLSTVTPHGARRGPEMRSSVPALPDPECIDLDLDLDHDRSTAACELALLHASNNLAARPRLEWTLDVGHDALILFRSRITVRARIGMVRPRRRAEEHDGLRCSPRYVWCYVSRPTEMNELHRCALPGSLEIRPCSTTSAKRLRVLAATILLTPVRRALGSFDVQYLVQCC